MKKNGIESEQPTEKQNLLRGLEDNTLEYLNFSYLDDDFSDLILDRLPNNISLKIIHFGKKSLDDEEIYNKNIDKLILFLKKIPL